jgi:hypothetical protein
MRAAVGCWCIEGGRAPVVGRSSEAYPFKELYDIESENPGEDGAVEAGDIHKEGGRPWWVRSV